MRGRILFICIAGLLASVCLAVPGQSAPGIPDLKRSYQSALMSYLYIEPWEVRHEVLAGVKQLTAWMELDLRGDEYIEADELVPLQEQIAMLLLSKNPVLIDGKALNPTLIHSGYVRVGPQGMGLVGTSERLELATATVGVIISYRTGGIPQQVSVDWELFSDQLHRVPVTATDPSGPQMIYVTPDDNIYTWTNFLKNYRLPNVQQVPVPDTFSELQIPIGTLLCVLAMLPAGWRVYNRKRLGRGALGPGVMIVLLTSGALFSWAYSPTFAVARPAIMVAKMDDAQAVVLLQALLKNIYRALSFPQEQDVHDKLVLTVSDTLLADIYRQHHRSFNVPEAGGSPARVRQLGVQGASARPVQGKPHAYVIHGQWSALATVGHWGYRYERKHEYDARLTVEAKDGSWKVTGLELLDERRVEPELPPAAGGAGSL